MVSTSSTEKLTSQDGVISFLDILGWKGIWTRYGNQTPLDRLDKLVSCINTDPLGVSVENEGVKTQVIVLSDTIIISSTLPEIEKDVFEFNNLISRTIEDHGSRIGIGVVESIQNGIPIRGATNCGKFLTRENSFVGSCIDEAATWYENTDWIGVHLCPSATLRFVSEDSSNWISHKPPFKGPTWQCSVVDWCKYWQPEKAMSDRVLGLKEALKQNSPFTSDIWLKYYNTIEFASARFEKQTKSE